MTTVLCLHAHPDAIRGILEERFEDLTIAYASTSEEIVSGLKALQPEVVFSIKGPELPGHLHYQVVESNSVKWLQVGGSGYEHIEPFDTDALTVTNSAGVLAQYLAETVTGAMLALNGNFFSYHRQQQNAVWHPIPFRPIAGQTLLVVGLGHIGARVALNAKALGMHVLAVRRRSEPVEYIDTLFTPDQLAKALPKADFVSLHVRANPDTRHMMNAATLTAMKPGAFLFNTARGPVVDTSALLAVLQSGHLGGAYLDVFEEEPLPGAHPLWAREDVFITPHSSDNIAGWDRKFTMFFADNMARWLRGEPLVNQVRAK